MARYADRPGTELDIDIAAPPADVWELVSDINVPARFSGEFLGAEWLDEPGPGARFEGRNARQGSEWTTTSTVSSYEPSVGFGWTVGELDNPTATWEFQIEPAGTGSRLRMLATMGPGPSGVSSAIERRPDKEERIIELRLEEWRVNMQATLQGIKELAEAL